MKSQRFSRPSIVPRHWPAVHCAKKWPGRLLSLCVSLTLLGAEPESPVSQPPPLSLEEAIALAQSSHPDLAEGRALAAAAAGRADQAGLWPNPELVGGLESIPFSGDTRDTAQYLAGIAQTIPSGQRLSKARQVELAQRNSLLHQTQARWQAILSEVRKSFATALYQQSAATLQTQVLANARQAAEIAQARLETGDTTIDEVARSRMTERQAHVEAERSRRLQEQSLSALFAAMGNPDLKAQSVSGSLEEALEIPTLEAVAVNLYQHPAINAALADQQEASTRIDLAKARRIPDIDVELLYRRIDGLEANTFDLGLRIPLPTWQRGQGQLRAARAEREAAQIRTRATADELQRRLTQSQAQLTNALATARSLREDILPHADSIRATMQHRLAAGDISLAQFLPSDRDWTLTQIAYLESLRNAMIAWAEVRSLVEVHPRHP